MFEVLIAFDPERVTELLDLEGFWFSLAGLVVLFLDSQKERARPTIWTAETNEYGSTNFYRPSQLANSMVCQRAARMAHNSNIGAVSVSVHCYQSTGHYSRRT
jgi:hypothetical protein